MEKVKVAHVARLVLLQPLTGGAQYPYAYGQQMGYWYPQGYPAAAAQIQGQFLQGMQGYTAYGTQFGYQQAAAAQYMG
jgi:nucleolysin TIA-1/TIAR